MSRVKSPAKSITDAFVAELGKRWPERLINWATDVNGKAVPWSYVKQAIACLDRGDIAAARACLMRPVTIGLEGGPDISGILSPHGRFISWEIKTTDQQSEQQKLCQRAIEKHGGIYIVVRSVDQGIRDTDTLINE
jgi:hypothetical protein